MEDTTIISGFGFVDNDNNLREIEGTLPKEGEEMMRMLFENEEHAILIKKGEQIDASKIYKVK